MAEWLDAAGRFFNPEPRVRVVPLPHGSQCVVVDDALANPEGVRQWAATQAFGTPSFPYPGLVLGAPKTMGEQMAVLFAQHARAPLGGRRTLQHEVRMSVLSTPPEALEPLLWQCHRDRVLTDAESQMLVAAGVLYLFDDPALGGTSFYRPLQGPVETDRMLADSAVLDAATFSARHGVQPGYMTDSNAYFERVARVLPVWNRAIFYDGSLFHAPDVDHPTRQSADVLRGRLTLNGFFACRRAAA
ncbi:DUF6445 family protein [Roseateles sp.]|uniref:DUF6445 family protein n=1 Tax=Roseateles sp. TaxID=1971397 RepID=UPI0032647528